MITANTSEPSANKTVIPSTVRITVREAQWIHARNCLREILKNELPDVFDPERWEQLASE